MLILTGKNLGERHKELNMKVKEAVSNNVDFEQIKDKAEQSDVDKLFKIDLASKYKNIEYIIEVLKSGDALYVSKALKCTWIYEDQFSSYINVDYLHHNVYPYMSLKMKKKLLTSIYVHLRNVDRVNAFCNYCMDMKLTNIALKFLIFTSDDYKLQFMKDNSNLLAIFRDDINYRKFIGDSFTLAEAYILAVRCDTLGILNALSYLYYVSDEKYLDMLEKHNKFGPHPRGNRDYLGPRISKDIIIKHKDRCLLKPSLYMFFLNKTSIVKNTTPENAKTYVTALLPEDVEKFWSYYYCESYEFLLNIIPAEERFEFIKRTFNYKYPNQPFETNSAFYSNKYYRFMTDEQKSDWALNQIASQNDIFGAESTFKWYKFINFDRAFGEIKKLVMITPDADKRNDIVDIIIESAKTQKDLEKVFTYYYDRHNNEKPYTKERFVNSVMYKHNVFEFDRSCWDAFDKIFQNLDVYSTLNIHKSKIEFKITSLIYHVINNIDVPEGLTLYLKSNINFYTLKILCEKISKEKQEIVYEYLLQFYTDIINELNSVTYEDEVKYKLRGHIHNLLDLLCQFERTKNDIPEVVTNLIKLDWDEFHRHKLIYEPPSKITQDDLIRLLKKDVDLVVKKLPLPLVQKNTYWNEKLHLGRFLKKLRVYFSNDISKEFLNFYNDMLKETKIDSYAARAACYGIFQLAEDNFKSDFMMKYAPKQSKVNRKKINESILNIQEAICATAFYSRPPVALKNMLMYLKGDYVQECLPMFNFYSSNLPLPLCMSFIEGLLDNPVSIQKHGLRLAFAYFNAEDLGKLVLHIWKKSKNVSLRLIIYKALYNKVLDGDKNMQTALFEILIILTLELREDDSGEVFTLYKSRRLPEHLISNYIEALWRAVSALPNNNTNSTRTASIIDYMCSKIRLISTDIIQSIVEVFVKDAFSSEASIITSLESTDLNKSKWKLTAYCIIYTQNIDDLQTKLELTKFILTQCSNKFNIVEKNKYIVRNFCTDFLRNLLQLSFEEDVKSYEHTNMIIETVLKTMNDLFAVKDIYMIVWAIRFNIVARKVFIGKGAKLSSTDGAQNRTIIRDNALILGKEIGNVMKEYIEKDMYFEMFVPNIQNELILILDSVERLLWVSQIKTDDLIVVVGLSLMEFKMKEMYKIVLNILPSNYRLQYEDDFKNILDHLINLNDVEIMCKIYDKFVLSDFEPRPYLQL